ncbi:Aminotransferase-like plant mobile domain [Arabidopsis thaliana x Arabidopsis arenosa]|uniref:Aminotransferase-like plant mobile domain n=1 Tax=Arabidopsis thaliana x Arabidopsis arenosa TaxID=1240361 RepID=A0A8T2CAD7_9BRAS|nr:Aminotransferase-like plant mobile domain [Arabidopsis thaliana x Arabidopsis arenosa]
MVSKKGRCLKKTHFLKPFATSINGGSVSELPRRDYQRPSDFSLELKRFSSQVSFSGFWFAERRFLSWVVKMEALHAPTWKKAGIFDAIKASTYNISKNVSLILSVTEKWCPETKSFVFPWGEATITLEDVMVLLGFSVLGSPVFTPLKSSEMRDAVEKLEKERFENRCSDGTLKETPWISSFLGRGGQMEHEAFLVLWLSLFVFPATSRRAISKHVAPVAVRLARGERIALAPVVLSILYRDLGRICDFGREKCADKVNLKSLFKLVQVWTWERFRNIRPKAREIPKGEPRIAQWDSLQQRNQNVRLSFDDFEWRPYTKDLKNWNPLRFYVEEAIWVTVDESIDDEFASFERCVRVSQLAGNGFVEDYFPNRVAMQFGLAQDLPGLVTRHRIFTEKEAWDDYSKSFDGLNLYMPSRLGRGSVTSRYRVWWRKSVSKFLGSAEMHKESTETFSARKKVEHYDEDVDDIDASPKVLPLSHVVQKLEEGSSAKRRRSVMHRSVKQDKIGGLVNSGVSSGWKMNKTSEDFTKKRSIYKPVQLKRAHEDDEKSYMDEKYDKLTIGQRIRSSKKYSSDAERTGGDASETLGKRTRRYMAVDSDDDSEPCQKPASMKIEQRSKEDDETASKAQKTSEICDDFEVDVNENTVKKKSMIDDKQQNGSIMQSIGSNGTNRAERLVNEDGEKKGYHEKLCSEVKKEEEIDERLKQRKLAIKEMEVKLEARIIEMEKILAMIRKWKTRGNMTENGVFSV